MGGVGGLDKLVRRGEIVTNDDVDVLLVGVRCFLRVLHAFSFRAIGPSRTKTTSQLRSCQESWCSRRGSNPATGF